jgi:hypothetical protein
MAKIPYSVSVTDGKAFLQMKPLVFPNRCACCGEPNPGATYKQGTGIITGYRAGVGRQYTDYIWVDWQIPYCPLCQRHDEEFNRYSNDLGCTVWGGIALAGFSVVGLFMSQLSVLAVVAILVAGLALVMLIWGRTLFHKIIRRPTCYKPTLMSRPQSFLINHGNFSNQSPLEFTFYNQAYEAEFAALNELQE